MIYTHVKPAQPTSSTAPPLPCKIHPAQRLSITLVGNPTEREPHHYPSGKIDRRFLYSRALIRKMLCLCFLYFGTSGIEGEQSFEDEQSPARRRAWVTTGRPGGALLKSATGDTTSRERYVQRRCVRYHLPKEHEESATRATAEGG